METLRIALLSWESMHSVRTGGLAPAVTGLAEGLAAEGHEVHLFTRRGDGQGEHAIVNGVSYHRCSFAPGHNIIDYCWNMGRAMVARISAVESFGRFDVIHGHDWHVVEALHELKQAGRSPLILTYHSTEFGRNGNAFGSWWEFHEISGKEWYGGLIADKITTVSRAMKGEIAWLYKHPEEKIHVVPNGIDPRRFQREVDPGRVKARYGIHPLAPTILFIGRLVHQKGPDLLVEAIPRVLGHRWDAKFIIAGQGDMRGHLEHRARVLGVDQATRFLGYLPDGEYVDLLNSADIVCIPSRNEPFGMVLLEAWSARRAVVGTEVGGLRDNIENFRDGVKVFINPESIAWGINYVIDDPVGVRAMGKRGLEKVEREFTWPKVTKRMLEIYNL
ncbi:MAG: glycosyltransferase family 4 protein [Candidatus Hydrothermarchaeota archaeon]